MSEEILEQTAEELEEEQQAVAESLGGEILDETKTDVKEDEEEEESSGGAVSHCSGQDACIADLDSDGTNDTLLMIEDAWYSSSIGGLPAFVYANGGCFDGALTTSDLMYANSDGYYEVDFSRFAFDCTVEMTLINSVGTDGGSPTSGMGNWYWWQNASFCSAGHSLCELQDNGTSWEEWLLSLSWDPTTGLRGNGNGFTSNSQL